MQQVNLYQASLKPPRQLMSSKQLVQMMLASIALVVVLGFVQSWFAGGVQQALQELQHEQKTLLADIEKLNLELSKRQDSTQMTQQLKQLEQEVSDKQQVMQALKVQSFGNTRGFARYFSGLARQHIDGVWLTSLRIQAGGQLMDLKGNTHSADLLPRYLQQLAKENSFNGIEFKTFLMQRSEESGFIEFDMRGQELSDKS
jgi:MSHA biogenesis protein MshI